MRIDKKFRTLKAQRKKAFIAYITAGDPSLSMTEKITLALERSGVDMVELGIPFSDPLADGPVIQAASLRALRKGASLKRIFSMVRALRRKTEIPLVFMTYYNPVLKYGLVKFMKDCKASGVDGVIVPDLPFEEAGELIKNGRVNKVSVINLVAPTSTGERIRNIARKSTGFIYYVSLTGVTGARRKLPVELISRIKAVRAMTDKPLCVGFGISGPEQAKNIAKFSDGIIVGSAIVKIIENNLGDTRRLIYKVSSFSKSLAKAIHGR